MKPVIAKMNSQPQHAAMPICAGWWRNGVTKTDAGGGRLNP